jgi:RHS repeat-associated protein
VGNGQLIDYGYDGYSRLSSLRTTITGLGDRTFTYSYDEFSRPDTLTYPNGFKIKRLYHMNGFQVQTQDITDAANPKILSAIGNGMDARGNFTDQLWGNGVITKTGFDSITGRVKTITSGRLSAANTAPALFGDVQALAYDYDSIGNLKSRNSQRKNASGTALENLTESFAYDRLNRLTTSTTSGLFARIKNYSYDNLGNLTNRSNSYVGSAVNDDVGALSYVPTASNNAGLHAVTAAGGINYAYDKYGNMTQRGNEAIIYNVFNKPTRITGGAATTDIWYGAAHERFKETSNGVSTYTLAGGLYEEVLSGVTSTQKSYVDGVVLHTKYSSPGGTTNTIQYLHTDNLGSVDSISDALGSFVSRMSFSDWGKRQKSDWKNGAPTETFPTAEGYTGHHQLDQHALVHMGGRVYDPNIGRFMSADLFVQSPYSSQSFNRYSYVFNNPMSRVDPTGYQAVDDVVDEFVVIGSRWNAFDNTGDHMSGGFSVGGYNPTPGGHDVDPVAPEVLKAIGDISGGIIGVDLSSGSLLVQASDGSKWTVKIGGQSGGKNKNGNGLSVPKFNEKDPRFHHYNVAHSCNKSDSNCTSASAKDGLSRYPAPGAAGQPVKDGDVSFAVPVGSVRHVLSTDGSIVNVTLEGRHLLDPGIVMRWISEDSRSVTIHTYGEGTGPLPRVNEALAETLWHSVDENIFEYMHTTQSP